MNQFRCGNCGHHLARLFTEAGRSDPIEELVAECAECKSKTVFRVSAPRFEVGWGDGAEGVFCVGWGGKV